MRKKIVIVTGASSGIGIETVRSLLSEDMHLIMACRNLEKAAPIKEELEKESSREIDLLKLDLANLSAIEAFAKEFGGEVMNFEDTLTSVKSTLAKESAMVQKKQAMMAKKGEMMYNKMCKPIDAKFNSIAEAKTYLRTEKPCGDIKGKPLQVIGLYLNSRNK